VTEVLSSHVSPIYINAVTISKSTKSQTKHFKVQNEDLGLHGFLSIAVPFTRRLS
jgi:hypothetical protein